MKVEKLTIVFGASAAFLLFFLFVPVLSIFLEQFLFRFDGFVQALFDYVVLKAVGVSVFAAFVAVLVSFVFGVPLAYLLARNDFPGKGFIEGIIDLPMAIPHTVAGIALLVVLGSNGLIGGQTESFLRFEETFTGIVAAMTFVSAPYLVNSAKEGFQSVNPRLENVARNLGASKWQSFRKISFPLAFPHIFSGAIMSWARAISEFSAVILLVGFFPMIAPGLIWSRFYTTGLTQAISVSIVLLIIILPTFITLRYAKGKYLDKY